MHEYQVTDVYRIVAGLLIKEAVKLDDSPVYLKSGLDELTVHLRVDP